MQIFLFDIVENIVGEEENTGYKCFLIFPCFQKTQFKRSFKLGIVE